MSNRCFVLTATMLCACALHPSDSLAQSRCCGNHTSRDTEWPTRVGGPTTTATAPTFDEDCDEPATQPGESDAPRWDVNDPPGPWTDVSIDTDEGTWMNVDVSHDGSQIAFDLLGDIYVMPVAGGEAKSIVQGIAWDMQPRFSPDGRFIAFTSDRGGGDNIWIVDSTGGEPSQVSKETFRLLNSPAWSPDGEFIVARKHFTSRRSLGAGEMWLFHRSGGDGLQMTEKPNEQKDVGEPAFSPCGRYLYYSQDVTPGNTFEYNKDVNGEIYAIQRLDRHTGETDRIIRGPGGAIRPTPSPDGRTIAFIRRVRYRTTLFLHDVESGREWPLYDDLERDMQETWAIHGVYPAIAWTPDSAAIVFWARGKIRRIDIESSQVSVVPFRVRDTRRIAPALRHRVAVAPETFDVRLLRWASVSPAGDSVVYSALGRLYIRALPDGEPRRLTEQDTHFEYYPSFSRDGRHVVYVSWDDEALGAVRIVSAAGGEGRAVTPAPGHYVEPVLSPDGSTIVYRKAGGGSLTSPMWSGDQGVYQISIESGTPTRITRKGRRPQFGTAGDRVYLIHASQDGEKDKHELFSIDLDGSDERTEATSENAVEYAISPDGQWLAFVERFNAYVTAFPRTGKPISVGPKMTSVPVKRVSRDAGEFVHFSGDSGKLHWTLGPELYTRDLKDAFAHLEGAPETLPEPPESGVNISFKAPYEKPRGRLALINARLITMRGDEIIDPGTIVVEQNRIIALGRTDDLKIPGGTEVVDLAGCTIIPGLVDVHDHGPHGANGFIPEQNWALHAKLAFGVTTVHDPSHDTRLIFSSSELAKAGAIVAPRIFSTGTILYGAAGSFKAEVDSLEDAKSHLRRMQAVGAFTVKSYNQPRRDQRQQVIAAAREVGMMVVPEGGALLQHNLTMVVDGHTGVEHCVPVEHVYNDVTSLWAASQTGYTPTLTVAYGGLGGESYWYQHTNVWEDEHLATFLPAFVIDPVSRRRTMAPDNEWNHFNAAGVCKKFTDAGKKVNLGAHGQLAGLAHHWELWMFAQGGMTPLEVIRAGTLNPAHYLGLDGDIGSLEPGKLADLVVLTRNPLDDIRNTTSMRYVMLNGRLYDARTLAEIAPTPRKREPYFFHR